LAVPDKTSNAPNAIKQYPRTRKMSMIKKLIVWLSANFKREVAPSRVRSYPSTNTSLNAHFNQKNVNFVSRVSVWLNSTNIFFFAAARPSDAECAKEMSVKRIGTPTSMVESVMPFKMIMNQKKCKRRRGYRMKFKEKWQMIRGKRRSQKKRSSCLMTILTWMIQ
jgi:hypothetical protein